jgi:anti-anti-sigma regulatory factor
LAPVIDIREALCRNANRLFIAAEWNGTVGVLKAIGPIDASSAEYFIQRVQERMMLSRMLIIDLSEVTFFAVAGYHALRLIDEGREKYGAEWIVVPNAAVARVLDLCEPTGALPTAGSVAAARAACEVERWPA